MKIKYLLILAFFLNNIFANSKIFSEIIILSTGNVHGEIEPCG